jgi:hypothetical protein
MSCSLACSLLLVGFVECYAEGFGCAADDRPQRVTDQRLGANLKQSEQFEDDYDDDNDPNYVKDVSHIGPRGYQGRVAVTTSFCRSSNSFPGHAQSEQRSLA